jgi:chaperonin GroEL
MGTCIVNWAQNKFQLLPIRVQAFGEQGQGVLRDMAAATGATFYAKDEGYKLPMTPQEGYSEELFGEAERIIATKDRTTILGGDGDKQTRITELEAQLPNLKKHFEIDNLKERIAKLQASIGVIRVAAITETERNERKLRVEDAINATKAALDSGVVPGGGAALYRAAKTISLKGVTPEQIAGWVAVLAACQAPLMQMAHNSGINLDRSDLERVEKSTRMTVNFVTGEVVEAFSAGIIDPLKVVVSALRNASSAAALVLTTEAAVVAEGDTSEKI